VGLRTLRELECVVSLESVWGVWEGELNIGWVDGRRTNRHGWTVVYDYLYLGGIVLCFDDLVQMLPEGFAS
jgi:hypothetical protein